MSQSNRMPVVTQLSSVEQMSPRVLLGTHVPKNASQLKDSMAASDLGFGKVFAPFAIHGVWEHETGWGDFRIELLEKISIHPAASVIQYSQTIFEGLKAFAVSDGNAVLFRPDFHAKRFERSAERICLPKLPLPWFVELAQQVTSWNQHWIPTGSGEALYLRPTLFGSEAFLGVRPSNRAEFILLASPVGNYYSKGMKPLKILIETQDIRAVQGGVGAAKTGANYAASLRAGERAKHLGFDQVLWLDGQERKWIEEVGTMNIFFVMGDQVVTPALNGSILGGCTRDSVIQLLKAWGIKLEERPISLDEVSHRAKQGELTEIFGSGTAAVIAPVEELGSADGSFKIRSSGTYKISTQLLTELTQIQREQQPDRFGWLKKVELERM